MGIEGSVAIVTGANRGLGRAFTQGLLEQGAAKVYAGARDVGTIKDDRVVPVRLDITSPEDVAEAARRCTDVTLVVNNAGVATVGGALDASVLESGRGEMRTNVFGTLAMSQAFAPVLAANGGGALVNVLSVLSWLAHPLAPMYSASKAAAWSITNSLRFALREQGTLVVAVHCGALDTDMAAAIDAPKLAPGVVVDQALEAVRRGQLEVLADAETQSVKEVLADGPEALHALLAR